MHPKLPWPRRLLYSLVLLLMSYGVVEGLAFLGLYARRSVQGIKDPWISSSTLSEPHSRLIRDLLEGSTDYIVHSPSLGWTIQPGGRSGLYTANHQGLRAEREFDSQPPPGIFRIASYGDSFTHCDQVPNQQTWQKQLSRLGEQLQVMNFGVPGYGLDQAYLRYQETSRRFFVHMVLIGYMSENIYRHVNVFRPFYYPGTGFPLGKPRFLLVEGKLELLSNPLANLSDYQDLLGRPAEWLPRLGRHDHFFQTRPRAGSLDFSPSVRLFKILVSRLRDRPPILNQQGYDTRSAAFRITTRLLDRFAAAVRENQAQPVIVFFPNREDLDRFRRTGSTRYAPLLDRLKRDHQSFVDLANAFPDSASLDDLVHFHYTPLANRLAAEYLFERLDIPSYLKRE